MGHTESNKAKYLQSWIVLNILCTAVNIYFLDFLPLKIRLKMIYMIKFLDKSTSLSINPKLKKGSISSPLKFYMRNFL